jgi:sugar phosphate isomerase/epimerase
MENQGIGRRQFLACLAATGLLERGRLAAAETSRQPVARMTDRPICAFVKFIQELSFDELARTVAELGFDGIEATIRKGGQILPENVEDELPKLVEALQRQNLEITVMTSDVNDPRDALTEKVLRTAAGQGVKRYRMSYYRYDLDRPVLPQIEEYRKTARELAAMNRELGLTAVYQNHSGARYLGASVWDLQRLLDGISPQEIGIAFDIRHATVEGGLAWPVSWNLVQPHLQAVYVKDFVWDGRRPRNVPLGSGLVDPDFFKLLQKADRSIPVSLHIEYLEKAGLGPNLAALKEDLGKLQRLLGQSAT